MVSPSAASSVLCSCGGLVSVVFDLVRLFSLVFSLVFTFNCGGDSIRGALRLLSFAAVPHPWLLLAGTRGLLPLRAFDPIVSVLEWSGLEGVVKRQGAMRCLLTLGLIPPLVGVAMILV